MTNINYLELFFKKHKLSGKITVKYSSPVALDDYINDIVFENGDVININDIIFDIESDFPDDVFKQWMEAKKGNDISLVDWLQTNKQYIPKDFDTSTIEAYHKELSSIIDEVKQSIDKVFNTEVDDSDYGESEDE